MELQASAIAGEEGFGCSVPGVPSALLVHGMPEGCSTGGVGL